MKEVNLIQVPFLPKEVFDIDCILCNDESILSLKFPQWYLLKILGTKDKCWPCLVASKLRTSSIWLFELSLHFDQHPCCNFFRYLSRSNCYLFHQLPIELQFLPLHLVETKYLLDFLVSLWTTPSSHFTFHFGVFVGLSFRRRSFNFCS